jgi:dipeptidyl aminopeptidase/acylaminoacyl peptidase
VGVPDDRQHLGPEGGRHPAAPRSSQADLPGPSLDRDGTVIAFVNTSPDDPGDVWPMDANGDGQRRVTDANPWLRERDLATTRPVTAGDHDGVPVEGWVTAYDGPNGRPLVVSVHGGPHYPVGWRFCFEAQRLAAQGYAVLTANPAGSGGYGRRRGPPDEPHRAAVAPAGACPGRGPVIRPVSRFGGYR